MTNPKRRKAFTKMIHALIAFVLALYEFVTQEDAPRFRDAQLGEWEDREP